MKDFTDEELQEKINYDKLCVLFFTASWCGPCKKMYPICKKLETQYNVTFVKVDVNSLDYDSKFANEARVLPTFLLCKQGLKLAKVSGAAENALEQMTKKYENYQKPKSTSTAQADQQG